MDSLIDPYEKILARMKDKFTQLAGYEPDDASDIGIRMKVLAGELYSISCAMDWLCRQTFPQTAEGKQLEYRAMERGLSRKPAAAAEGVLTFSRKTTLWYSAQIPAGTVCASSGKNAARYVTTETAVLPVGSLSVDVAAKAEEAGTGGNANPGSITRMVTPPADMEAVENKAAFAGGTDAESDDDLRARLLDCWREPANGTNAAWYRQLAESCDGVRSARVVPRANGAGTAAVYLGGKGAAVSDEAVQRVRDLLCGKREINVDVAVAAAQTVPVDVTCTVKAAQGQNAQLVKIYSRAAIKKYFYTLGVGDPVVPSAISSAIFATGMVSDCIFSSEGKSVAANELAVPGQVGVAVAQ